jgi:hypothetical protein
MQWKFHLHLPAFDAAFLVPLTFLQCSRTRFLSTTLYEQAVHEALISSQ